MTWEITVENIAGILEGSATLEPGLNAVRASNWHGKSSFVEAIKTGLGVSRTVTEGRDHGRVHMVGPDRDVEVELCRENGGVVRRGQPFLDDEYDVARVDLFACLDETNDLRRTVREGGDLEPVLLRPLDFQNIDQRIADLRRERERVESELAQAREAKKRLPTVTEKINRLEAELDELRERQADLTGGADDASGVESTRSDLAGARSDREQAQNRVEQLERRLERIETRLAEKRSELDDLEVGDDADVESELATARDELDDRRRDVEVLQSVHSATELVLSEGRLDLVTDVERELTGDSLVCWTCGSTVDRADVESKLSDLGERLASRRTAVESLQAEVEDLEDRREQLREARRRRTDLEAEIDDLEERRADTRRDLEAARNRLADARSRVEALSESVDRTVEELTDVESEIKYREVERKELRDERDSLSARAERVETLSDERERLTGEIASLRNRKDEIKHETRAAFDDAMGELLDRFDTGFETARLTPEFDIVVARDGHEASLDALSEGELELLGFVAALAGYEAFDVAGTVPFMLVDGVGGLADENLHTLVEYLRPRTDYLVFTAYPEHTAFDGHVVDPSGWSIAPATPNT